MARLTALKVRNAKPGRHGDGDGLYLLVKPTGARSWLLRIQREGKRQDIGLGSVELSARSPEDRRASDDIPLLSRRHLTLLEAREKANELRKFSMAGRNPILERDRERRIVPTFEEATKACHEDLKGSWSQRQAEAPGKSVTMGLARRAAGSNYAAMPYTEVPAFVATVMSKPETIGRLALLFAIHTAARSGEVRHTRWSHIDFEGKLWNRPAEIMKARADHTVTLTEPAIASLRQAEKLHAIQPDALIFPSSKGKPLSDMTLSKILRDAKVPYTVHGFRSSFRDWAAEKMPEVPDAVAEAAIAHVVPDKVVRAYKRTKFIAMRRDLLEAWGSFCLGSLAEKPAE